MRGELKLAVALASSLLFLAAFVVVSGVESSIIFQEKTNIIRLPHRKLFRVWSLRHIFWQERSKLQKKQKGDEGVEQAVVQQKVEVKTQKKKKEETSSSKDDSSSESEEEVKINSKKKPPVEESSDDSSDVESSDDSNDCHYGHKLCSTCKTRVQNQCPTCRQEFGDGKAPLKASRIAIGV